MSWHDEMESHIEMRAEMNERAGMDPVAARLAAEKAFGNRAMTGEAVRAVRIPLWVDQAWQDLRHAGRGFARAPGFTATAVAVLALGIGAATAVFSFTDRILFRPLPYANEHELVWFGMRAPIGGGGEFILEQNRIAWQKAETPFSGIAVSGGTGECHLSELNPVFLSCANVSANFLAVFGYHPAAGRGFSTEDGRPGAPKMAMISHALWKQRFQGGGVEGKSIDLDGTRTGIAGVLPASFEMPSLARVDILRVLQFDETKGADAPSLLLTAFARMRPGVTIEQARTRMQPLFADALETVPRGFRKEVRFVIHALRDRQIRDSRGAAILLMGAVMLVLAIAIANVANLLVARAAARGRELAVRAAIGASRARLARQTLTETLALGITGGAFGLAAAAGLLRLFRSAAPAGMPGAAEATIDWRIATFALAAVVLSSILAGLAPALRTPPPETLTGGRVAGRRREWLRPVLVMAQISLSLVLLCGAALMMQSLQNMASAPLGIETAAVFTARAQLPGPRYPEAAQRTAFWRSVSERVSALPGVEAVAISDSLPPEGRAQGRIFATIGVEGRPKAEVSPTGGMVTVREVSASYFPMLGIPLRRGRFFGEGEALPAVLSERMAARLFPGEDAVGKRIHLTGEDTLTVTGIAGDVRNGGLFTESDPELYRLSNRARPRQHLLVRADTRVIPFVREAFREQDPRLPVDFETLDARVRNMRARPRFQSMLLAGFAVSGLILAAAGLYGVIALLTAQRTGEFGVRMALGATAHDIRSLVLRQAGAWTSAGVVTGLCAASASAGFIRAHLYGTAAGAPWPLAAAVTLLGATALVAAWLPARRASRVAPLEALREL